MKSGRGYTVMVSRCNIHVFVNSTQKLFEEWIVEKILVRLRAEPLSRLGYKVCKKAYGDTRRSIQIRPKDGGLGTQECKASKHTFCFFLWDTLGREKSGG